MFGTLLDKLFNRPLTEEAFAQKVIKAAREAGFRDTLEYVPNEFRLKHGDGGYFNLHNAFRDYQKAEKASKPSVLGGMRRRCLAISSKRRRPLMK